MRLLGFTLGGLLASSLVVAAGVAQTPTESRVVDPMGDAMLWVSAQNVTRPGNSFDHIDLLGAWISNETMDTFEVGLRLKSWADPLANHPPDHRRQLRLRFHFDELAYVVSSYNSASQGIGCTQNQAMLSRGSVQGEEFGVGRAIMCLDAAVDTATGSWRVVVPKDRITSREQVPIQTGQALDSLLAWTYEVPADYVWVWDRAPDAGRGLPFLLQKGAGERHGDLFLVPRVPVRASNGEATTMVFPVNVTNRGTTDDVAIITTKAPRDEWKVRAPARVRVPAGQSATIPVILSMEFTHDHGATQYFEVRAASTSRPGDFATVFLGVHWLEIPQPAGHHDRLWLHSAPQDFKFSSVTVPASLMGGRSGWINAVEEDPRKDATDDYLPGVSEPGAPEVTYWALPLAPSLQMGLDLDHERKGLLETRVRSSVPSTTAVLDAQLEYCESGSGALRAGVCLGSKPPVKILTGQAQANGLPVNGVTRFQVELAPNPDVDVVSFAPGSNIKLVLALRHDTPQSFSASYGGQPTVHLLIPESTITLPLTEYHDPVDQAFENIGSLSVVALDALEKRVNPGRSAAFRFDLTNEDERAHRLRVSAEGINLEWVTIVGEPEFELGPDGRRQVTFLVRAPDDAQPGERAELFFVAEGAEDPNLVALARLRAEVVDPAVAEMTDEAGILQDPEPTRTPALSVVAVIGIAMLLAIWRRSRRNAF